MTEPPAARREPRRIEQLGRTRVDEYAWMKDENWQRVLRDPGVLRADIRAHLEAENAYTAAVLRDTEADQAAILAEFRGRMVETERSVPLPDGPWEYYSRYEAGAEQPVHARHPRGVPEREEVLLDCAALARESPYFHVGGAHHSPDHALYAWAEDRQGSEVYRILLRRLADGAAVGEPVDSSTGSFAFSPCGRFLFWVFRDDNGRPSKVYRRPVGGAAADDVLVFHERDEGMFLGVSVSSSREYVLIGSGNQETSEVSVVPAAAIEAEPRLLAARERGVRYDVEHWPDERGNGRWVIRTDADGAIDFKLVEAPEAGGARADWRDLLGHAPGRFIVAIAAFRDFLLRVERVDANDRIVIRPRDGGAERVVAGDDPAYALGLGGAYEWDTRTLRFSYENPRQPRQVIDLDMGSGARTVRKTQEVPSGHDPDRFVVRRLHARAPDGAIVPVTLLARADALAAGPCPTLLYGYGSYGIPMQPRFSVTALSLVERGWVWATAHVRGGSEKGWGWFLDGRGAHKANSFTDFVASAEALLAAGVARPGAIVAHGGSAGGMLMGAVANLRPDLWAGIAAAVPFVDVLNTMSDASLPLTPPEWPEWGNPLEDAAAYDRIASYSPYDRVGAQPYPPILALGGLSDPRVTYWEPAKWIARLRAHATGAAPMLLRINMEAGHGGASGRYDHLREPALVQAFALWAVARGGAA